MTLEPSAAAAWALDQPDGQVLFQQYQNRVKFPASPWAGDPDYSEANVWLLRVYAERNSEENAR